MIDYDDYTNLRILEKSPVNTLWVGVPDERSKAMETDTTEVELKAKDADKIKENIFLKEIVRCKDCKFNKAKDENKGVCGLMVYVHNADDYCSYGERKEQDNE